MTKHDKDSVYHIIGKNKVRVEGMLSEREIFL